MSGQHIEFVAPDLAFEGDRRRAIDDPLAELLDHVQLLGDL